MKKAINFTLILLSIFSICIGGFNISANASELENKLIEEKDDILIRANNHLRFGVKKGISKYWADFQLCSMIQTGGVIDKVDIHFRPVSKGNLTHPVDIPLSVVTTSDFKIIYRRLDGTIYSEKQFSTGIPVREIATHLWGTTMKPGDSIQVTYTQGENQFVVGGNVSLNTDNINFSKLTKTQTHKYAFGVETNGLRSRNIQ